MNRVLESLDAGRAHGTLAPYRLLASRVIGLAMRDLVTCARTTENGDSARAFLSGSPMLTHWCEVAEINPEAVRARVRRFVRNGAFSPVLESEH